MDYFFHSESFPSKQPPETSGPLRKISRDGGLIIEVSEDGMAVEVGGIPGKFRLR
jgi:hypothetical protein